MNFSCVATQCPLHRSRGSGPQSSRKIGHPPVDCCSVYLEASTRRTARRQRGAVAGVVPVAELALPYRGGSAVWSAHREHARMSRCVAACRVPMSCSLCSVCLFFAAASSPLLIRSVDIALHRHLHDMRAAGRKVSTQRRGMQHGGAWPPSPRTQRPASAVRSQPCNGDGDGRSPADIRAIASKHSTCHAPPRCTRCIPVATPNRSRSSDTIHCASGLTRSLCVGVCQLLLPPLLVRCRCCMLALPLCGVSPPLLRTLCLRCRLTRGLRRISRLQLPSFCARDIIRLPASREAAALDAYSRRMCCVLSRRDRSNRPA